MDTNIILDALLHREPFMDPALLMFDFLERSGIAGYVSAATYPDIYYIVRRIKDSEEARKAVETTYDFFRTVTVDSKLIGAAIQSPISDMEDALQYQCALKCGAEYLITRDKRGFPTGPVKICDARQFIQK